MADNSPPPGAAPIFIVGFSRSGTSLLRSMLNAHQNIYISQESGFYQWLSPDRLRGCDTAADWLRGYSRTASFRLLRVSALPALQAVSDVTPRSLAGPTLMPLLLGEKARRLGRARWGDKTPLHSLRLDAIFRDFPDAAVIHVTRHPVGVADSLARMPWGCDSGVFNGLLYRRVSAEVQRFGPRVLRIRLEDLVREPRAQLERALAHIGEPWSEDVLDHAAHTPIADDPPLPWLTPAASPLRGSQAGVRPRRWSKSRAAWRAWARSRGISAGESAFFTISCARRLPFTLPRRSTRWPRCASCFT